MFSPENLSFIQVSADYFTYSFYTVAKIEFNHSSYITAQGLCKFSQEQLHVANIFVIEFAKIIPNGTRI